VRTTWSSELTLPVSEKRDHIQGAMEAPVTLLEYGDYECPYCGAAYPIIKQVQERMGDRLRFVFRNFPITTSHPHSEQAAEAAEAAAAQGRFWELHDVLISHQDELHPPDLREYALRLGLDEERFWDDLRRRAHVGRVARDVESADLSRVAGTPTFFVNGRRHLGAYDAATLGDAVRAARARTARAGTE